MRKLYFSSASWYTQVCNFWSLGYACTSPSPSQHLKLGENVRQYNPPYCHFAEKEPYLSLFFWPPLIFGLRNTEVAWLWT